MLLSPAVQRPRDITRKLKVFQYSSTQQSRTRQVFREKVSNSSTGLSGRALEAWRTPRRERLRAKRASLQA
jgi:hypothetical protein